MDTRGESVPPKDHRHEGQRQGWTAREGQRKWVLGRRKRNLGMWEEQQQRTQGLREKHVDIFCTNVGRVDKRTRKGTTSLGNG